MIASGQRGDPDQPRGADAPRAARPARARRRRSAARARAPPPRPGSGVSRSARSSASISSASSLLLQRERERVERAAEPRVDRSAREVEHRRDLPGRVAQQVTEDDDRAVLGPEIGERGDDVVADVAGAVRRGRRSGSASAAVSGRNARARDQSIARLTTIRCSHGPSGRRRSKRSSARSADRNASCAMSSAAAASWTTSHAARWTAGPVAPEQLVDRLAIPALGRAHERGVRAAAQRPPHAQPPRDGVLHGDLLGRHRNPTPARRPRRRACAR